MGIIGVVSTGLDYVAKFLQVLDIAFEWGSLGGVIANVLDYVDGNRNGVGAK